MALKRYKTQKYASLEINRSASQLDGQVPSQLVLAQNFTEETPCENGMWLDAERANGEARLISTETDIVGIVYTTEIEFGAERHERGLKWHRGVYPECVRMAVLQPGDVYTTNCFWYDTAEFADDAAVDAALDTDLTNVATALFVVPSVDEGAPKLTATKPTIGLYGRVVKKITVPNGEPAIKYHISRV